MKMRTAASRGSARMYLLFFRGTYRCFDAVVWAAVRSTSNDPPPLHSGLLPRKNQMSNMVVVNSQ